MSTLLSQVTGYNASKHTPYDPSTRLPPGSLDGKVYAVTGGHAGIGLATTRFLFEAGAKILICSRTESKVADAISEILQSHPQESSSSSLRERLQYIKLDLNSLHQVEKAAEEVLKGQERLDGIVCNAGIMHVPYKLTEDGIEQQFQVNHLGHFLFVTKLFPLLEKTSDLTGHPSRVVNVSSFAHNFISLYPFASLSFDSKSSINRDYGTGWIRYSVSKLSNIYFAKEINQRCTDGKIRALSVHPGFVKSNLYDVGGSGVPSLAQKVFIEVEEGAYSSVYAVADEEVEEKNLWGSYLCPFAKVVEPRRGNDMKKAKELWDLSEALVREALAQ